MQQAFESLGTTFSHRVKNIFRYKRKEEAMKNDLDAALRSLHHTNDEVTHYTLSEGGLWITATNGCVPWNVVSFKTKHGAKWNIDTGWAPWVYKNLVMPEDPKHPMNFPSAHYRIPIAILHTLPEQMQKDFHIIRERVEQICDEAKEARMFAEYVQAAMKAQCVTTSDEKLNYILRDAYAKFKRPQ